MRIVPVAYLLSVSGNSIAAIALPLVLVLQTTGDVLGGSTACLLAWQADLDRGGALHRAFVPGA